MIVMTKGAQASELLRGPPFRSRCASGLSFALWLRKTSWVNSALLMAMF